MGVRVLREDIPNHYFTIREQNGKNYIYIDNPYNGKQLPIHFEPTHKLASEWCKTHFDILERKEKNNGVIFKLYEIYVYGKECKNKLS